ncbi:MAG: beta-lactamase family protein [Rickettsiales bacterium]|jgi:D-alanyl-D-alanine carboxypeptidase|nr:beta-lactamase family protein [Rickettsiales bacterium]
MKRAEEKYDNYSGFALSSEYFAINTGQSNSIVTKVCSNTKAMVASLLMKLSELDVLNLNDEISDNINRLEDLPEGFPDITGITIKEVLSHRSGLKDYFKDLFPDECANPSEYTTRKSCLARLSQASDPSKGYNYSNTNYLLLGIILDNF